MKKMKNDEEGNTQGQEVKHLKWETEVTKNLVSQPKRRTRDEIIILKTAQQLRQSWMLLEQHLCTSVSYRAELYQHKQQNICLSICISFLFFIISLSLASPSSEWDWWRSEHPLQAVIKKKKRKESHLSCTITLARLSCDLSYLFSCLFCCLLIQFFFCCRGRIEKNNKTNEPRSSLCSLRCIFQISSSLSWR